MGNVPVMGYPLGVRLKLSSQGTSNGIFIYLLNLFLYLFYLFYLFDYHDDLV